MSDVTATINFIDTNYNLLHTLQICWSSVGECSGGGEGRRGGGGRQGSQEGVEEEGGRGGREEERRRGKNRKEQLRGRMYS